MLFTALTVVSIAKIQQSVLGDEHPMVLNTMDSIDFVEQSKDTSIPSAKDLLAKWTEATDDWEHKERAMCTSSPAVLDRVLSLNVFTSIGWFKRMEDAVANGTCGDLMDDGIPINAPLEEPPTPKADASGRYSI